MRSPVVVRAPRLTYPVPTLATKGSGVRIAQTNITAAARPLGPSGVVSGTRSL